MSVTPATSHSAVPALPQELIDVIIDFLHDNTKALRCCTRVCKTWTSPARYHLFSHVTVLFEYTNRESPLKRLRRFLTSDSTLGSYIKNFTLIGICSDWSGASPRAPEADLAFVLSKLVEVRRVTLKSLVLWPDESDILRTFATLPKLEIIWMFEIDLSENDQYLDPATPTLPTDALDTQLTGIVLKWNSIPATRLKSLADDFSGRRERLGTLFLTLESGDHTKYFPIYTSLMAGTGAHLTYLDIDIRHWCDVPLSRQADAYEYYEETFKQIPFSSCTRVWQMDIWMDDSNQRYPWIAASVILDMMSRSAPLRELTIAIGHHCARSWDYEEGVPAFDEAVGRLPQIQKLTLTCIEILDRPNLSYLLPDFAGFMPTAQERNILDVQYSEERSGLWFTINQQKFPDVRAVD